MLFSKQVQSAKVGNYLQQGTFDVYYSKTILKVNGRLDITNDTRAKLVNLYDGFLVESKYVVTPKHEELLEFLLKSIKNMTELMTKTDSNVDCLVMVGQDSLETFLSEIDFLLEKRSDIEEQTRTKRQGSFSEVERLYVDFLTEIKVMNPNILTNLKNQVLLLSPNKLKNFMRMVSEYFPPKDTHEENVRVVSDRFDRIIKDAQESQLNLLRPTPSPRPSKPRPSPASPVPSQNPTSEAPVTQRAAATPASKPLRPPPSKATSISPPSPSTSEFPTARSSSATPSSRPSRPPTSKATSPSPPPRPTSGAPITKSSPSYRPAQTLPPRATSPSPSSPSPSPSSTSESTLPTPPIAANINPTTDVPVPTQSTLPTINTDSLPPTNIPGYNDILGLDKKDIIQDTEVESRTSNDNIVANNPNANLIPGLSELLGIDRLVNNLRTNVQHAFSPERSNVENKYIGTPFSSVDQPSFQWDDFSELNNMFVGFQPDDSQALDDSSVSSETSQLSNNANSEISDNDISNIDLPDIYQLSSPDVERTVTRIPASRTSRSSETNGESDENSEIENKMLEKLKMFQRDTLESQLITFKLLLDEQAQEQGVLNMLIILNIYSLLQQAVVEYEGVENGQSDNYDACTKTSTLVAHFNENIVQFSNVSRMSLTIPTILCKDNLCYEMTSSQNHLTDTNDRYYCTEYYIINEHAMYCDNKLFGPHPCLYAQNNNECRFKERPFQEKMHVYNKHSTFDTQEWVLHTNIGGQFEVVNQTRLTPTGESYKPSHILSEKYYIDKSIMNFGQRKESMVQSFARKDGVIIYLLSMHLIFLGVLVAKIVRSIARIVKNACRDDYYPPEQIEMDD